jgi:hypothetical protein
MAAMNTQLLMPPSMSSQRPSSDRRHSTPVFFQNSLQEKQQNGVLAKSADDIHYPLINNDHTNNHNGGHSPSRIFHHFLDREKKNKQTDKPSTVSSGSPKIARRILRMRPKDSNNVHVKKKRASIHKKPLVKVDS